MHIHDIIGMIVTTGYQVYDMRPYLVQELEIGNPTSSSKGLNALLTSIVSEARKEGFASTKLYSTVTMKCTHARVCGENIQ